MRSLRKMLQGKKLTLAILWRDLSSIPRRKRFYWKRASVVSLGGAAMLWGLFMSRNAQNSTMGLVIFSSLSLSSLTALIIISVTSACWIVMREKEDRTLEMCFLTDISCRGFLSGKVGTCMFLTSMVILSVLPIFMLGISLGGISMTQVLLAFAVLISTVFCCIGIGIMSASLCNSATQANTLISVITAAWLIGLPTALTIFEAITDTYVMTEEVFTAISPFVAMSALNSGNVTPLIGVNCLLCLLAGALFVRTANAFLPGRIITRDRGSILQRIREKLKTIKSIRKWVLTARLRGNPVAWKDLHFYHGGTKATWVKCLASVGITLVLTVIVGLLLEGDAEDLFFSTAWIEFLLCTAVLMLGSFVHFGMTFTREKRARTLEVLLTSDLSTGEILRGKIQAAMQSLLPWLIFWILAGLCLFIPFADEEEVWEFAFGFTIIMTGMWFAFSSVALWMSLKFKRAVAAPACILMFLFWNAFGAGIRFSVLFWDFSVWAGIFVECIIYAGVGITFLSMTNHSLRTIASNTD